MRKVFTYLDAETLANFLTPVALSALDQEKKKEQLKRPLTFYEKNPLIVSKLFYQEAYEALQFELVPYFRRKTKALDFPEDFVFMPSGDRRSMREQHLKHLEFLRMQEGRPNYWESLVPAYLFIREQKRNTAELFKQSDDYCIERISQIFKIGKSLAKEWFIEMHYNDSILYLFEKKELYFTL